MALKTLRYIAGSGGFPSAGSLPAAVTKTGTITSLLTIVTGTGTQFTKDLVRGQYLYNSSTNEVRKITGVSNDTTLIIESAFTSELSASAVYMTEAQYVSIAITATGGAFKDGVAIATGQFISFNSDSAISPFTYSGSLTFDVGYTE
jgi:hypothetical protein